MARTHRRLAEGLSQTVAQPPHVESALARGVELAYLLLFPVIAFWLMHFKPVAQNGFLDPYIYTGYIHNFSELVHRYGLTYYSVRFGLILPAQLASAVVGPVTGYFLLRYCLVLVAGLPFYAVVKQRCGRTVAISVFAVLLTSPFLARTVLWDHPDASAVPFLFGSMCLFALEHRRRRRLDLGAGALGGMAVHSNFFAIAPLALFVGIHALLWLAWRRGFREIIVRLGCVALGLLVVTAAGAAYYWWKVDQWDIFSVTATITSWLATGGTANWRTQGAIWVMERWWVLTPLVLSVFAILPRQPPRVEFGDVAIWAGATSTALFLYAHQFLLNGNSLELSYYFSYTLPAVFLLLALSLAAIWKRRGTEAHPATAPLFVASSTCPWLFYSFEGTLLYPSDFIQHVAVIVAVGALVVLAAKTGQARPRLVLVATAAMGLMFFGCFARPLYASMINNRWHPSQIEEDVYRVALQFIQAVPDWSERPGHIRFWYSNEPAGAGGSLQSIQSTFLWGYSKVQGDGRGLPYLGPAELGLIQAPDLKWLALLAEDPEKLSLGRAALREHGIQHTSVVRKVLSAGTYTVHFELLDLGRN